MKLTDITEQKSEDKMKYKITFEDEQLTCLAEAGTTVLEVQIAAGMTPDAFCGGNGKCGKCKVVINGKEVLACKTAVDRDMTVYTGNKKEERAQILAQGSGRQAEFSPGNLPEGTDTPLLSAVDIGSTSVVAYLLDGTNGELLGTKSILNPQRQFGADVVSRCSYALNNGGEALSGCIRNAVNILLRELAKGAGRNPEDIVRIVMVGNSCMHHLFLGIPTDTLALAPYTPKVTEAQELMAARYDIHVHPRAQLWWLPNIGGFVGADTVGCLVASDLDTCEEMTLLVDIGTNGELVLGNRDGLIACSTAAGPAFEGAKITCGMRGSKGAIDHVTVKDGETICHVIGETEAVGICGSGLLDGAACLLKLGKIDETGRLEKEYHFTDRVFLNQKDIRELQLAKAAIAAGIRSLCEKKGIKVSDISRVLIAGAFGNYLDPASACAIGMIPPELQTRITSIGNAAGEGACMAAVNREQFERSRILALVDIGTNGELVLGNRDGLIACSTAAGPAFEGAKITCGMRGSKGAIDHVTVKDGETICHVIGETEAVGICGSGLLDGAACLLKLGKIDETGRLEKEYHFTDRVFLNQKDIRELQLAKAAIAAGIRSLCEKKGIKVSDISRVLIAGAFGNYLDPASACAIGMIPPELQTRITSIGNAAGEGACMAAVNREQFERSRILAQKAEFVELALDMGFQEIYVEEMEFPGESEHE